MNKCCKHRLCSQYGLKWCHTNTKLDLLEAFSVSMPGLPPHILPNIIFSAECWGTEWVSPLNLKGYTQSLVFFIKKTHFGSKSVPEGFSELTRNRIPSRFWKSLRPLFFEILIFLAGGCGLCWTSIPNWATSIQNRSISSQFQNARSRWLLNRFQKFWGFEKPGLHSVT